ncbi:hypothetical protein Bbelb_357300 [Branchiostoma belcheri]|nr:hypothetical protein Bbelb_357300 [Branchiostoma belcheri]
MPVMETETDDQLMIGYGFSNKLCKIGESLRAQGVENPCPGHDGHCSANFDPAEPIGNAERVMGAQVAWDMLGDAPVVLAKLLLDNDGKVIEGAQETYNKLRETYCALKWMRHEDNLQDPNPSSSTHGQGGEKDHRVIGGEMWERGISIEKEDCTVHVSRGQRRAVFRLKLSPQIILGKPIPSGSKCKTSGVVAKKTRFCHILGHALSRRCQAELAAARRRHPTDHAKFYAAVSGAKSNILDCFSGNHTKCKDLSSTCKARPNDPTYRPKHLPWGRYLCMTADDRAALMTAVEYKLSGEMVQRQRNLRSNNKCEATHQVLLKSVPKSKTWKRNAAGRAASAAHSVAVGGMGESIVRILATLGCKLRPGGPASKFLSWADKKAKADRVRQRSAAFKSRRAQAWWRKENAKRGSGYRPEQLHPNYSKEHSYSQADTKCNE